MKNLQGPFEGLKDSSQNSDFLIEVTDGVSNKKLKAKIAVAAGEDGIGGKDTEVELDWRVLGCKEEYKNPVENLREAGKKQTLLDFYEHTYSFDHVSMAGVVEPTVNTVTEVKHGGRKVFEPPACKRVQAFQGSSKVKHLPQI